MSLELSQDQIALKESIRAFFAGEVDSKVLRAVADNSSADSALWNKIPELGLLSYFCAKPEDISFQDLALVAFEAGRVCLPCPLVEAIFAGPYFLNSLVEQKQKERIFEEVKFLEARSLEDGASALLPVILGQHGSLKFSKDKETLAVAGELNLVPLVGSKNWLLIIDNVGEKVFLSQAVQESQVEISAQEGLDLSRRFFRLKISKLELFQVTGVSLGEIIDRYRLLKAAEIAGASARAVELTAEYVKTRKQFGVPVGGFQAVQHKLADAYLHAEALRALSNFAAWAADHSPEQLELAARSALTYATETGPEILESAIQLHGGIGFTWEYDLHFFLRRVKSLALLFGSKEEDFQKILAAAGRE